MFDKTIRKQIDPLLAQAGHGLSGLGVSANGLTWAGMLLGMAAAVCITYSLFWPAILLIGLSRLCDGLDGMVARASGADQGSDLGGFLDIVLDFAFYGMIPFAFILLDPQMNGVAGGLLLLVFYVNGASFLTFALMAEKRGIDPQARGSKSLLYTAGLAEATETIGFFLLCCLLPDWFAAFAYVFAAIVLVTTTTRFVLAYRSFGPAED